MKGILEFDLNDKFEEELFQLASRSKNFYLAIKEFDESLRGRAKYGEEEVAQQVRENLQEFLDKYDVNLDMLS